MPPAAGLVSDSEGLRRFFARRALITMNIGFVMDPIGSIKIKKDTTFAMLLAAQGRGWSLRYMELNDLFVRDGVPYARMQMVQVRDDPANWFTLSHPQVLPLASLDVVLMRKDPPFNLEYVYATYILERAEQSGVLVINKPQSLRDANEKMYTIWFPQCCPPTLVTRGHERLRTFLEEQRDIVVKPLDGMGGASIFRVTLGDPNTNVIFETLTMHQARFVMAQCYIPEISRGDKRILLIDGMPVEYALARVPAEGDLRGNLAAGATGIGVGLSERDRWICAQVGPVLREKGLVFVGLDVIGDFLTEINVTSPTCIRELDAIYDLNIAGRFMDHIAAMATRHGAGVRQSGD
jgi:glutathione synthase